MKRFGAHQLLKWGNDDDLSASQCPWFAVGAEDARGCIPICDDEENAPLVD